MKNSELNQPISFTADIIFSSSQDEQVDFNETDWVELFPFGLSLSNDASRPFMIFKDKSGDLSLPVPINQSEAGAALLQSSSQNLPAGAHQFAEALLQSLDIRFERCLFVEIKGVSQYVRLYMQNHPRYQSLKFRAEDVMSLCLHFKIPFFASKKFINSSKIMSAQIVGLAQNLAQNPLVLVKPHHYLM